MISLGTYRSAVPARRTKDARLQDNQANLRARRAGPTGIGRRAGRLAAPDPLRKPVPEAAKKEGRGQQDVSVVFDTIRSNARAHS